MVSTSVLMSIFGTAFSHMAVETLNNNLLAIPFVFNLLQKTFLVVFTCFDLKFFTLHLGDGVTFKFRLSTGAAHPCLCKLVPSMDLSIDMLIANDLL